MAHRWSNFSSAFNAYNDKFDLMKNKFDDITTMMNLAYTGCPDPVDRTHFYHLYGAIQQVQLFLTQLTDRTWPDWQGSGLFECLYWLDQEHTEAGAYELTMDDILSVMLSATDDEYKKFIGIVDAYRIGLWNKPFNSDFYAALGRGFI